MRVLHLIIYILFVSTVSAQQGVRDDLPKERTNQFDGEGRKHGTWVTITPARMGEPTFRESGSYYHGEKTGKWYKADTEGELMSMENYVGNALNGEVRYYDKGLLYCEGTYRGLNPLQEFDTIVIVDPVSHLESFKVISTDKGTVRHGTWRYYNPRTAELIRIEEYQVDELVYKREFVISSNTDSLLQKLHEQKMPHNSGTKSTAPVWKKLTSGNKR